MSGIDYLAHELGSLFVRLADRYGAEWTLKWDGREPHAMVAAWRDELAAFNGSQQFVASVFDEALRHLPERPVNAPQFRVLCQQARDTLYRQAKERVADNGKPVRGPTPEERAQLHVVRNDIARGGLFARPSPEWAFRLIAKHDRGERVAFAALRMARDVVDAHRKRERAAPAPIERADYDDSQEATC